MRDRYAQCHGDCTVDCGACKGAGRPTALSEPPAYITSPALLRDPLLRPPSKPPAETQQDDEREAVERIASQYRDPTLARFAINDFRDWLAARPAADPETLRERIEALVTAAKTRHRAWSDHSQQRFTPTVPVDELHAALDAA